MGSFWRGWGSLRFKDEIEEIFANKLEVEEFVRLDDPMIKEMFDPIDDKADVFDCTEGKFDLELIPITVEFIDCSVELADGVARLCFEESSKWNRMLGTGTVNANGIR